MLLAIDAGNTNVVFAVYDQADQVGSWRCATHPKRTADEYGIWLIQLMSFKGLHTQDIDAAIIASVVPSVTVPLRYLCHDYFECRPLIIGESEIDLSDVVRIDRLSEVGADRLVNTVAASANYTLPLIVIDFGTATTFDVVDEQGHYIGGVIAPGIHLSLVALEHAAARLPLVDIAKPDQIIGKDTISCMQSGIYWGFVSMIEGVIMRINAEYGRPMEVIGTGGLASLFAESLPIIDHLEADLTLNGLRLIYERTL